MNRRIMMTLLILGIIVAVVILFIFLPIDSGEGRNNSSSFIPFIPIWFTIMIPIYIANQEKKKKEEQAINKLKSGNRYNMMKDMVEDLNDDELQYLYRKLHETANNTMTR